MLVPVGHLADEGEPEQDWPGLVARARAAVLARLRLEDVGIDDVEEHLQHEAVYTPRDWQDRYNVAKGSTFGLNHNFSQVAAAATDMAITLIVPVLPPLLLCSPLAPAEAPAASATLFAGGLPSATVFAPTVHEPVLRRYNRHYHGCSPTHPLRLATLQLLFNRAALSPCPPGSSCHPGSGLPNVLVSARLAVHRICTDAGLPPPPGPGQHEPSLLNTRCAPHICPLPDLAQLSTHFVPGTSGHWAEAIGDATWGHFRPMCVGTPRSRTRGCRTAMPAG